MTCAMRASVGEITRTQDGASLMMEFLERNAAIARAEGFGPSDKFLAEYRTLFSDTQSKYTASMLRDIERGNAIEADHTAWTQVTDNSDRNASIAVDWKIDFIPASFLVSKEGNLIAVDPNHHKLKSYLKKHLSESVKQE